MVSLALQGGLATLTTSMPVIEGRVSLFPSRMVLMHLLDSARNSGARTSDMERQVPLPQRKAKATYIQSIRTQLYMQESQV